MKKQFLKIVLNIAFIIPMAGFSQSGAIQPCDTYNAMEQVFKSDAQLKINFEATQKILLEQLKEHKANLAAGKTAAFEYTIPVVFHILHQGGAENITDAQCIAALNQVNSDLQKLGADAGTVAAPFAPLYVNSEIKLMLAKKDPNGNCTNGIVHKYDTRTNWDRNPLSSSLSWSNQYAGITWNPTKYLNIIIVKNIVGAVGQTGQVIGYTFIPGTAPATNCDAIVYNYTFLTGLDARSLSHETGHWLGLPHTFGNTNNPGITCGDDGLADTPPTKGYFSTCPSSLVGNTCVGNGQANVENIMDYSSCPKNFTQDQTTVMRNVLASGVASRNNLSSPTNITATDVNGVGLCAPIAEFLSTNLSLTVCAGGSLTMKDFSYNGVITSYQWAADAPATVASPAASITVINFPVQGTTNVTLTVSNANGTSTRVKTVTVMDNTPGIVGTTFEGFESVGLPANWQIVNGNAGSVTWEQTNTGAYEGFNSYYINGNASGINHEDILVMPLMDLLNSPGANLNFRYAYARASATHTDQLSIQGSKDCGGTWQDIQTLSAGQMATNSGGISPSGYIPSPNEWKLHDVSAHPNWNNYTTSPNVIIRYKFKEAGFGNNIYIDAINLTIPTGVNELTKSVKLALYPNPSSAETTLSFHLSESASVQINVVDVLGKVVLPVVNTTYSNGEHTVVLNKEEALSKGIYFVDITLNGAKMSKKLLIE